ERGEAISSDLLAGLIAGEMLERFPGSVIAYDVRSSRAVPEWIREHGGTPVRGRVGHTFMKRLIAEQGAYFAGELSGHYYFAECFNPDSALMAMIQLIRLWQQRGRKLSELVAPLRRYAATGEINFRVEDVPAALARVEDHARSLGAAIDHLDGLSVDAG